MLEELEAGDELLLGVAGEECRMLPHVGDPQRLQKVEGWSEAVGDAAGEQSRPSMYDSPQVVAGDADLAQEEGEDGEDVVPDAGFENLRAQIEDAAELRIGEAVGAEEVDHGKDAVERRVDGGGSGVGEVEDVDADGFEEEELLLENWT